MSWFFVCDSDQHFEFTSGNIVSRKGNAVYRLLLLQQSYHIDFLLSVGDAICHGADGSQISLCGTDQYGNEYQAFLDNYINQIEKMGIDVKLCIGNHDINKWKYPNVSLLKYIRDKHNGTYSWFKTDESGYYRFMHKGYVFMCLGLYPKNVDWLKKNLPIDNATPIIIYFHYNTDPNDPWSDWWTEEEKNKFYNAIAEYNVKLIINGHMHTTKHGIWNGIPYIVCADGPNLIEVNNTNVVIVK